MNPLRTDKTIENACVVQATQAIVIEHLDATANDPGARVSFVGSYSPNLRAADPWRVQAYERDRLTCCCIWREPSTSASLRCVMSDEGMVNIYGPGGSPDVKTQVPDAGVWRRGAPGYGYVHRIRQIGATLYVCGDSRQVYRWVMPPGSGDTERRLARGRFLHMDAGMLQPPMPPHPGPTAPQTEQDRWIDSTDSCPFWDINGPDESDIYAAGDETWHWNGQEWRRLDLPNDGETIYCIKVIDSDRVVLAGRNGYVLVGNARTGFTNISNVDDNQNFTGIEWFMDRLWLASNVGLFVWNPTTQAIEKYATTLVPDLQDTHLLESRDGVLWSFGHKDLAYLDTRGASTTWVRVHHPDNPRIGAAAARPARRTASTEPVVTSSSATSAQPGVLAWLPAKPVEAGQVDLGGLMAWVGHRGAGSFVREQLALAGQPTASLLKVNASKRYAVDLPRIGLSLALQYTGPKAVASDAQAAPEHWALAEVTVLAAQPPNVTGWSGPWPGGLSPGTRDALDQARALWGAEQAGNDEQATFFVEGVQGAAWVVNVGLRPPDSGLKYLKVMHMGGYLEPIELAG